MKHHAAVLLLGISLFAISARAGESKIEGVVLGANDRPLRNTTVEIVNETSPQHLTKLKTNDKGVFLAPGLMPGSYTVAVFVNPQTRWLTHQVMVSNDKATHLVMTSNGFANAPRQMVWLPDRASQSIQKVATISTDEWEKEIRRLGLYVH